LIIIRTCFRLDDIIDGRDRSKGSTQSRLELQWFYCFTLNLIEEFNGLQQDQRERVLSLVTDRSNGDDPSSTVNIKPYKKMINSLDDMFVQYFLSVAQPWKEYAEKNPKRPLFYDFCKSIVSWICASITLSRADHKRSRPRTSLSPHGSMVHMVARRHNHSTTTHLCHLGRW
jgi:hypothetical protein